MSSLKALVYFSRFDETCKEKDISTTMVLDYFKSLDGFKLFFKV